MSKRKYQQGLAIVPILIAVVILIGLVGVGYYFYTNNSGNNIGINNLLSKQETHVVDGQTIITGDDIKLPANFPTYVPIYPKADITTASYKNQSAHLQQNTSDDKSVIVNWYKDLAKKNNWKTDLDYDDTMVGYYTLSFSTDDLVLGVSVQPGEGKNGTTLVIFNSSSKDDFTTGLGGNEQTVGETYEEGMQKLKDLEEKVGSDY